MNDTTTRRLKLFGDAEHFGAEILKSPGWMCAVCRTYDQIHCFGRGKPKTVDGSNEIDRASNLRDDEGIGQEAKAKRDSDEVKWVEDGIGFDDQPFEAGWCVAGGDAKRYSGSTLAWHPTEPCSSYAHGDCYANAKVKGEQCPYLIFLEEATGKLYISNLQYSRWGMMPLKDGWVVSDYNNERNGFNEGGIERRIKSDGKFADIFQLAAEASLKGLTGAPDGIDVRNPERPRPSYGGQAFSRPCGSAQGGLTVRQMYAKIYRLVGPEANTSMKIMYRSVHGTKAVTDIIEGVNSRMTFVTSSDPLRAAITLKDLVAYLSKRAKDDRDFQRSTPYGVFGSKISGVWLRNGCIELS